MNNVIAGIKDSELNDLSLEVIKYRDRISDLFEKVDACMERLQSCYVGEPSRRIANYAENLHISFSTAKDNIKSYADDFTTLISKMHENDQYLSSLLLESTEEQQTKNNNNDFSV
ncbi:MAG: hypothetical protein K5837_01220 [Candidatus Saccharibacteria bacterium]|nr:hypothetical protein [Candidatus Saccharibacteria bacterium]